MIKTVDTDALLTYKIPVVKNWGISSLEGVFPSEIEILDGEKITGTFFPSSSIYYNEETEPRNKNGSYKRIIYEQIKSKFYLPEFSNIYPEKKLSIENKIKNIRIPKKMFGERILENTFEIKDYSSGYFETFITDDGLGNLIAPSGKISNYAKIEPINSLEERIVENVIYTDNRGDIISPEEAIVKYANAEEVYENVVYKNIPQKTSDYDPTNEQYGFSIDSSENYLLSTCFSDEFSNSLNLSSRVILNKKEESSGKFKGIKIFNSPFQSSLQIDDEPSFLSNGYGDFLLHLNKGELCVSQSFFKDEFGKSLCVEGDSIAISSPNTKKCQRLCEDSGSGLVFCYEKNKGGEDNWGIINVLEGDYQNSSFGHSVYIKDDILVVGAPHYSGSLGAVYIYRKKIYNSKNKYYFTPTASFYNTEILLSDVTGSYIDGKVAYGSSTINKKLKISNFRLNFWRPVSEMCFGVLSTDDYDKVVTDQTTFGINNLILTDEKVKYFTEFDDIPDYVQDDPVWIFESKLVGEVDGNMFGGCVCAGNNFVVIGNINEFSNEVYVYKCNQILDAAGYPTFSWSKEITLTPEDCDIVSEIPSHLYGTKSPRTGFGKSITVNNNFICIGSPYERIVGGYVTGTCNIYKRGYFKSICGEESFSTTPFKKISSYIKPSKNSYFGYSMDFKSNSLVISAPNRDFYIKNEVKFNDFDEKLYISNISDVQSDDEESDVFIYSFTEDEKLNKVTSLKNKKESGDIYRFYGKSVSTDGDSIFIGSPEISTHVNLPFNSMESQKEICDASNWINSDAHLLRGMIYYYEISSEDSHVGNIFYENGQIVINSNIEYYDKILSSSGSNGFSIKYSSEESSYSSEVVLPISPGEFNRSTNPTAIYGNKLLLDVNGDKLFTIEDLNYIIFYLNEESILRQQPTFSIRLEDSQNKSWWKSDNLLTESEDLIIAQGISDGFITSFTAEMRDRIKTSFVDTKLLDINGDGIVDYMDGNLLTAFWLGKLTFNLIQKNVPENSERKTLDSIVKYIKYLLGKAVPYNTPDIASGSIFNTGNGGYIDQEFFNYYDNSYSDPTGSYLSTYITGVGMYNNGDLIAVAKLGSPLKNPNNYPINISIKFNLF